MSNRVIPNAFHNYQKARLAFVQSIAELASRAPNVESLHEAGVTDLLKPLLTDPCQQIQQGAAIALGRLINVDQKLAQNVICQNFLPILINSIQYGNKYHKRSVLFVIRGLCKHDESLARQVVNNGGLQTIITCLEDFDTSVKESAASGVVYVVKHSQDLAQTCADSGVIPLLLLCLQEPELSLKLVATTAIGEIASKSLELAQNVVDAGCVPYLVKNLNNTDEKLKKQILYALCGCAKHSCDLAEVVVEAEIFPSVLFHLAHPNKAVRKNAACLIRDIVKHSLELTQLVVNTGGIGALIEVLHQDDSEEEAIPTITAIGYIAGHSEQLALSVIASKGVQCLGKLLLESTSDSILATTTWALGQIGKHSPEHTNEIASADLLPRLLYLYLDRNSSEDLKLKAKNTLKLCLQKCLLLSALDPLLYGAPPEILKYVLGQYSKVLPHDPKARRLFVTSGGLKKVQEIDAKVGTTLYEYILMINSSFPDEIVRYYSPGYSQTLLEKVEQYSPQMMTLLRDSNATPVAMQTEVVDESRQMSSDSSTLDV